jgi:hypothetical protein
MNGSRSRLRTKGAWLVAGRQYAGKVGGFSPEFTMNISSTLVGTTQSTLIPSTFNVSNSYPG